MFPSYRNQSIDLLWKDDGKIGPLNPTLNKVTEEINSKSKFVLDQVKFVKFWTR